MRVEQTIVLDAAPDEVWAVIHDPSSYDDVLSEVGTWRLVGEQTSGVGARYRFHMQVGSALVGGLVEFVESTAPCDLAWTSITGIDHRGRWRVRELEPGRTRVTLRLAYQTPGGLLSLVTDRLAAPLVGRNLRRVLDNVRLAVERRRNTMSSVPGV